MSFFNLSSVTTTQTYSMLRLEAATQNGTQIYSVQEFKGYSELMQTSRQASYSVSYKAKQKHYLQNRGHCVGAVLFP